MEERDTPASAGPAPREPPSRSPPGHGRWLGRLALAAGALFVWEGAVMLLLGRVPALSALSPLSGAVLDAALVAFLALPALYVLLVLPGRRELRIAAEGAERLRDLNERLRRETAEADAARERYRLLFEETPILCVTTRDEAGQPVIEECNRNFADALGYERHEVVGKPLVDFYAPESRASLGGEEGYLRALGDASGEQERLLLRRDGTPLVALLRARRLGDPGGGSALVLAAFTDVSEMRRAELECRQSEARFRELFDNMGAGVIVFEPLPGNEEFLVRDLNRAAERITRVGRDQAAGRRLLETFPGAKGLGLPDALGRVARTGQSEELPVALYADGQRSAWVENYVYRLPSGEVVTVFDDVTARVAAEGALADSERRYRGLVDTVTDFLFTHDAEGRLVTVNRAAALALDFAAEELAGRPLDALMPDEHHRRAFREEYLPRVQAQGRAEGLFVLTDRRGERHYLEYRTLLVPGHAPGGHVAGVGREVTAQRRLELTLARLGAALDQVGEVVILTDLEGGIQHVNPAFTAVTGYGAAEALGRSVETLLGAGGHPEEQRAELWDVIGRGETWQGRFRNRRRNGASYLADAIVSPLRDETGAVCGYVSTQRDVTREVEMEEHLRQAQKMDAVGRLAGGVAHDFNNLLTVINGLSELAAGELSVDEPASGWLQGIRDAGERAASLTRQLLAFARQEVVCPRALDLNEAVGGLTKMLRRLIGEDIELTWRPGPDLWQVYLDPGQVDQLLANLVVNARDAMPGAGTVTLKTANAPIGAGHPEVPPGEFVLLTVADSGAGMDPETLARIFEPFFTTKELGKGTGLGLATVYGIVKQAGGWVHADSAPGQGTTFRLYLPRSTGGTAVGVPRDPTPRVPGGTETVLLVEDEEAILDLGLSVLRRQGYRVLAARTPEDALRVAESEPGEIPLLVTDVVLPGMSGRELYEHLLSHRPGLKCLYLSGYTADVISQRGVLPEGVNFLQKPYTLRALTAKVRAVLDG